MADTSDPFLANYCVCFIDLLGQKKAMEGQSLLPEHATDEQQQALISLVKSSVGKIAGIHKHADSMLAAIREPRDPPGPLDTQQLAVWREMLVDNLRTQRWSDGLVFFTCLANTTISAQLNGIYAQFCLAGTMSLLGLAGKAPMRGGIDIAWGVELKPGELYGPALANAYILESECARFPRIVVGEQVHLYLTTVCRGTEPDIFSLASRRFAAMCLDMLARDTQQVLYLDYLSSRFEESVTSSQIDMLWARARGYIDEQQALHAGSGDDKLLKRYAQLAEYFDSRLPPLQRDG